MYLQNKNLFENDSSTLMDDCKEQFKQLIEILNNCSRKDLCGRVKNLFAKYNIPCTIDTQTSTKIFYTGGDSSCKISGSINLKTIKKDIETLVSNIIMFYYTHNGGEKENIDTFKDKLQSEKTNIKESFFIESKYKNMNNNYKLEKRSFPWYVTYYEESPVYVQNDGGTYLSNVKAVESFGFQSKNEAVKALSQLSNMRYNLSESTDIFAIEDAENIGDSRYAAVEDRQHYLSREKEVNDFSSIDEDLDEACKACKNKYNKNSYYCKNCKKRQDKQDKQSYNVNPDIGNNGPIIMNGEFSTGAFSDGSVGFAGSASESFDKRFLSTSEYLPESVLEDDDTLSDLMKQYV